MKLELEKDGHIVELMYTNRKATLRNVEKFAVWLLRVASFEVCN